MKKRFIAGLLVATMCATMLFIPGCGSSSKSKGTEIEWMFWDDPKTSKDLMTKGYQEVVDRFNKKYEGKYHCKLQTTQLADYYPKLNAQITAGKIPDMYMCDPGPKLQENVEKGACANMSEILDADAEWKGTFNDKMFEKLTYDGKIMAIPTNFAAACVYYNKELFQQAGIAEPPKTFDELIEDCKKLKEKDITPINIACASKNEWCLGMLAGYICDREGGPNNLDGVINGTGSWTDPSYKKAGEKIVQLSEYFEDNYAGQENDPTTAGFAKGKAAMLIQGSWAIGQINGENPEFEDKCGIFAFPASTGSNADPTRMVVKTDNLVMSPKLDGEKKDAVVALMKEFTNEEAQTYTVQKAGKMPVAFSDKIDYAQAPKQLQDLKKVYDSAQSFLGFYNESLPTSEAGDQFNNAYVAMATKAKTPDEALSELEDFFKKNVWKK